MNPLLIKVLAVVAVVAVSFGAGWRVKAAFVAERDLAVVEAKTAFLDAYRDAESGKAEILEKKLSSLRANERVINNEILKVVDRPVYLNECLDADGLRLIERARAGKADTAEPAAAMSGADKARGHDR